LPDCTFRSVLLMLLYFACHKMHIYQKAFEEYDNARAVFSLCFKCKRIVVAVMPAANSAMEEFVISCKWEWQLYKTI